MALGPIIFSFKYCFSRYVFNVLLPFHIVILEVFRTAFHSIKCSLPGLHGKAVFNKRRESINSYQVHGPQECTKTGYGYLQEKAAAVLNDTGVSKQWPSCSRGYFGNRLRLCQQGARSLQDILSSILHKKEKQISGFGIRSQYETLCEKGLKKLQRGRI